MLSMFLLVPALVAAPPVAVKPIWINVLPTQSGRVYGLGLAAITSDAVTLRQVSDNARADVISRCRANVKGDTRVTTTYQESRATGGPAQASRTQNAQVGTEVQSQATDLPGLVVEETFLDRPGGTGYALAYLDLGIAQRELQTRLDTLKADLGAQRPEQGVRGKLVAAQGLKKAHEELLKLDDMAGLLSGGGGDPGLRADVLQCRLDTERKMVAARSALTFGLTPTPGIELDQDVKGVVRNAVLREGMGWSDQNPLFSITLRVRSGRNGVTVGRRAWWDYQRSADFVVAQGSLSLTLVDSTGQEYESVAIVAKGVGVNEFQADSLLLADYKAKLGKAVAAWLNDLGKW
ncbi:MAG: hypothetical protein P4L36_07965 [Holophaga sp.]|nr:hypothetical protein [Holophaga sp.]